MKEKLPEIQYLQVNGEKYRLIQACAWCPKDSWPTLKDHQIYTSTMCDFHYGREWNKAVAAGYIPSRKIRK